MSGPLLLGIAAVGVGWAWIHRGDSVKQAEKDTAAANSDTAVQPGGADAAVVGAEVPTGMSGCEIKNAIDSQSTASTIGDIPVAGNDGGQTIPVGFAPEGGMVIKGEASTGGADPSTQTTGVSDNKPDDSPPGFVAGDNADTIFALKYGVSGGGGMTQQQLGRAYAESAIYTGEVF